MKKIIFSFMFVCSCLFLFASNSFAEENQIDSKTIKEAQDEVFKYLKDHKMNIKVGTDEFSDFLMSIPSFDDKGEFDKDLMQAYATTYLAEMEEYYFSDKEDSVDEDKFELSDVVLDKTISQVKKENEKENETVEKDIEVKQSTSELKGDMSTLSSFNRTKAKDYMKKNWDNTSSKKFKYFGGKGGDCTNYASQVVYAGGMKLNYTGHMRPGIAKTVKGWYFAPAMPGSGETVDHSTSWVRVVDFYSYWAGTKKHKVYSNLTAAQVSKKVSTGDVIQVYSKSSSKWFHTVVVYDVNSKGVTRYSGHSNEKLYAHLPIEFKGSNYKFRVIKF
ncbi:autolysin (amidase) [Bacillus safensis FO-36b]|uniref:amidase domain-containing protein n=1 Tax=Bacillus TaxID=1386 RepID=UPI00045D1E0F|nr:MULTISPECIES: amidase domain-containing protein [Bacillus]KDE25545.1 autolysin (amidase) [Bacillus safensis FO-36b]MEC1044932.1 amidase domain-containing protein [Bacillus altitudinis]MEC1091730.1 amidase domain-containing protein [Bacillus altitudinis]